MKIKFYLLIITTLALITHTILLPKSPPAITGDEIGFAYNAMSIWRYSIDEYGVKYPFIFKSFGDYKLPITMYLMAPFVGIWGINEWSVRLPIAVLSSFSPLFLYLIISELLKNNPKYNQIGLLSALIFAISPWYIHFSRGAWEASLGLLFVLIGTYFFLRSRTNYNWLYASSLFLGLSIYTYNAPRVSVPIIILGLTILLFKNPISTLNPLTWVNPTISWKKLFLPYISLLLIFIPASIQMTGVQGQSRIIGSSITRYWHEPTYFLTSYDQQVQLDESIRSIILRPYFFINDISTKFFAYLSPAQIGFFGDEVDRHLVPNMGRLTIVEVILILIGIYSIIQNKISRSLSYLILLYTFSGLLPGSITRDEFHSIRSILLSASYAITAGIGLYYLIKTFPNLSKLIILVWIGLYLQYSALYLSAIPREVVTGNQFGLKYASEYIKQNYDKYQQIIVDPPEIYGHPYIHLLGYLEYDARLYQLNVNRADNKNISPPVAEVYGFDKFIFRSIYLPEDRKLNNTLLIGTEMSLPISDANNSEEITWIKDIYDPKGNTALRLFEIK